MKCLLKLCFSVALLTLLSVSGCDNRLEFIYYDFHLKKCPSNTFYWPEQLQFEDWHLTKEKEQNLLCPGYVAYIIQNEEFRKTKEEGHSDSFSISIIQKENACMTRFLYAYDFIASKNHAKKNFLHYSKIATKALLPEEVFGTSSFEKKVIIGRIDEYKNWCSNSDKI